MSLDVQHETMTERFWDRLCIGSVRVPRAAIRSSPKKTKEEMRCVVDWIDRLLSIGQGRQTRSYVRYYETAGSTGPIDRVMIVDYYENRDSVRWTNQLCRSPGFIIKPKDFVNLFLLSG